VHYRPHTTLCITFLSPLDRTQWHPLNHPLYGIGFDALLIMEK